MFPKITEVKLRCKNCDIERTVSEDEKFPPFHACGYPWSVVEEKEVIPIQKIRQ